MYANGILKRATTPLIKRVEAIYAGESEETLQDLTALYGTYLVEDAKDWAKEAREYHGMLVRGDFTK